MKVTRVPCWGPVNECNSYPNEYDMLWLSNAKQVLGSKMWMWLLPIREEMKGQGFYYPKVPDITISDMNILLKDASRVHNTSFTVNDFESDPNEYIAKAVKKYGGNTFLIMPGVVEGGEAREVYVPSEEEATRKQTVVE